MRLVRGAVALHELVTYKGMRQAYGRMRSRYGLVVRIGDFPSFGSGSIPDIGIHGLVAQW